MASPMNYLPFARMASAALRSQSRAVPHLARTMSSVPSTEMSASSSSTKSRAADSSFRGSSHPYPHAQVRAQSSVAVDWDDGEDDSAAASGEPVGDLFRAYKALSDGSDTPGQLIGTTASVRRTFGPGSNAKALLTCGGDGLARSASFDPDYSRAQGWVKNHAVGPAVLSPVLISGLVGALVEAALPHSVHMGSSMEQIRPLIVGVEVCAKITVDAVGESGDPSIDSEMALLRNDRPGRTNGYPLQLRTEVARVQDGAVVSQGTHTVWVPDYMHM